jgi:uncharacterized membrane protein YphA (DoxX/SURF4 family)
MIAARTKIALTILQWALGVVILIEASLFLMPNARHGFAQRHMPDALRFVLGWSEIVGCILLLIPRTAVRGAWLLAAIFALALLTHLLHGMHNIGNLIIYIAAASAIAVAKKS